MSIFTGGGRLSVDRDSVPPACQIESFRRAAERRWGPPLTKRGTLRTSGVQSAFSSHSAENECGHVHWALRRWGQCESYALV